MTDFYCHSCGTQINVEESVIVASYGTLKKEEDLYIQTYREFIYHKDCNFAGSTMYCPPREAIVIITNDNVPLEYKSKINFAIGVKIKNKLEEIRMKFKEVEVLIDCEGTITLKIPWQYIKDLEKFPKVYTD
jgi:hypothetical protein